MICAWRALAAWYLPPRVYLHLSRETLRGGGPWRDAQTEEEKGEVEEGLRTGEHDEGKADFVVDMLSWDPWAAPQAAEVFLGGRSVAWRGSVEAQQGRVATGVVC